MNQDSAFDAVIVGTGQGGYPLAKDLAAAGWRTAIVEKGPVGGSCVNVGCTPTKTMVASARVAHLARRAADYGVRVGPVSVDLETVRRRKRQIVADFSGGSQRALERTEGLELIFGAGRFLDTHTVHVTLNDGGTRVLRAENVFINTGTRPTAPPIRGLEGVPWLDNAAIMELEEIPKHLIVLGGGYIGLEFGQMFRRFGSRVTIVQRGPQLTGEDPDVAEAIAQILRQDGVDVLLQAEATAAVQQGDNVRLTVQRGEKSQTLTGSHLLVAAGRTPNSDSLGLEAAGVERDGRGFIRVNGRLETGVPGVYALGDVKGGPAFTHIAYDDYRILKANLLNGGQATTEGRLVPYTMFIDPQLGRVGLSETQARTAGRKVRVAKLPMTHVARALELDETRGFMKAVVDAKTNQILGCAILGIEGGEVMSVLQMAMVGRVPYTTIRDGVFAHPTLAESLNNLFWSMDD